MSTATLEETMPKIKEAEQPTFTNWTHDLPSNFLECRTMGHRWQHHSATWDKHSQAYYVVHECDRCLTERRAWWNKTGEILSSSYGYVKGYLNSGTPTRQPLDGKGRQTLRAEYLSRLFIF